MKIEIEYVLTNDKVFIEEIAVDDSSAEFIDSFWKKLNENSFIMIAPLVVDKDKVRTDGPVHLLNTRELRYVRFFEVGE